MARYYDDELREIKRKERQVYLKRGIYPFLGSGVKEGERIPNDCIEGFQIERLFPKIFED